MTLVESLRNLDVEKIAAELPLTRFWLPILFSCELTVFRF
jgi:hypothetical protein